MSEKFLKSSENHQETENSRKERQVEKTDSRLENQAEKPYTKNHQEIDDIMKKIDKTSKKSEELSKHSELEEQPKTIPTHQNLGTEIKSHGLNQTLKKIQRNLPAYQRPFSKIIHNPKIETANIITGATIARPSGLFVGGLFSLLASVFVLIICKYYGYEYNFLIGLVSFAVGFVVGILFEFLTKPFRKT